MPQATETTSPVSRALEWLERRERSTLLRGVLFLGVGILPAFVGLLGLGFQERGTAIMCFVVAAVLLGLGLHWALGSILARVAYNGPSSPMWLFLVISIGPWALSVVLLPYDTGPVGQQLAFCGLAGQVFTLVELIRKMRAYDSLEADGVRTVARRALWIRSAVGMISTSVLVAGLAHG